eukprot:CAMPEP_0170504972 /NCGR_PEP_ID=MMETSP0208-20121228/49473_1 /TAXON_ID=197538 /ORGANISM="Strombidium inclinatum, Strain S3" /LENGTH=188 /DNA_ID=CAMNT_0010785533 /DNA_START=751 /DNA_END=1317 /DNA_ORIENTATION=-
MTTRLDHNSIRNDSKRAGKKKGYFSTDFDIDKMKAYCHSRKISVNDYMAAVLCVALHDYFSENTKTDSNGKLYPVPKDINVGMPISMRQPESKIENIRMENDISSIPIRFCVTPDFEEALKYQRAKFEAMKKSIFSFGPVFTGQFTASLPFLLPSFSLQELSTKFSFIFTNVNSSKSNVICNGKKTFY